MLIPNTETGLTGAAAQRRMCLPVPACHPQSAFGCSRRVADRVPVARAGWPPPAASRSGRDFHPTTHLNQVFLGILLLVFRFSRHVAPVEGQSGRSIPSFCGEVRTSALKMAHRAQYGPSSGMFIFRQK